MLDLPEIKLCICLDRDGRLGKFHSPMKSTLPCFFAASDKAATNTNRTSPRVAMVTVDLENNDKNCKGQRLKVTVENIIVKTNLCNKSQLKYSIIFSVE